MTPGTGALAGLRVIELGGIGPAPFAAMILADHGADVLRIARVGEDRQAAASDHMNRGKRSFELDLKDPAARERLLPIIDGADVLVEGFRPGVAERLGLGPDDCLPRNPGLVYGRMTGWGSDGPLSAAAGHDINYIALTGALHSIGSPGGPPVPPVAYVGDFGGGGLPLAFGVMAALWERVSSGRGQVVDAAIVDGAALLTLPIRSLVDRGDWWGERGTNLIDGGAPFYGVYETSDARHVTIGPLEPAFYGALLDALGLDKRDLPDRDDRGSWPGLRQRFEEIFRARTLEQWCDLLEGTDVCFAPVLTFEEAAAHSHNVARETFVDVAGVAQPAPAPRFQRTAAATPSPHSWTDLAWS